jgi:hypothetical protein
MSRWDGIGVALTLTVMTAAGQALPLSEDLARRAARLQVVAPKLRAKGAD